MSIYLTVDYEDSYSTTTRKRFEMVAATLTQAEIDAPQAVASLQGVSDALIRKWTIAEENFVAGPVGAGVNVDTGMTIKCQLNGRPEKCALKLPAPVASIINPDRSIDVGDTLMTDVFDLFDAAGTPILKISDGETLSSFIGGALDK